MFICRRDALFAIDHQQHHIGIAGRHIWIQAQPPGTVAACGADLDYLLEIMPVTEVVNKVLFGSGECGKVDWSLLGLSMPWWVLISLAVLSVWGTGPDEHLLRVDPQLSERSRLEAVESRRQLENCFISSVHHRPNEDRDLVAELRVVLGLRPKDRSDLREGR